MSSTRRSWIIPLSMGILLAAQGCSTVDSLFGGSDKSQRAAQPSAAARPAERPAAPDVSQLQVTQKERAEATSRLRGAAAAETAAYNGTVQDIAERLQGGAGPLNPKLLEQWTEARSHLARVDETVARMRALDADLTADRARARALAEASRDRAGAAADTAAALDATGNELATEIRRQSEWLAAERRRSDTLLAAVRSGTAAPRTEPAAGRTAALPFAAPPAASPPPAGSAPAPAPAAATAGIPPAADFRPVSIDRRRPFVAIRFASDDVDYEQALYEALKVAVDRDPAIRFDVVAVVPRTSRLNRRQRVAYADRVASAMHAMGLARDQTRTYVREQDTRDLQVHLYPRRR